MSKFVLTAQLRLQAPTNTRQVLNQMRGELKGLSVPVTVKGSVQAEKQIKKVTAATQKASNAANVMGKSFGVALKRFAAFTVASRAVSLFSNTLANAVDEAIDFQNEMVKVSQVTGKTIRGLGGLSKEITRLSTSLGASSKELIGVTRILSQAGLTASQTKVALEALAKSSLAATFDDIEKTAEGAVAILAQFGQGVNALERQLGAINAVAGQFAVESGDLIGAIRRTGGVFKAAGGDLNEFLGLFTSIRATTRESSESIATGLRTILTRIQRPKTIQYLSELGVQLTDIKGKFIGPFKAIEALNKAFGDLPQGDLRFVQIAEELGGFRQIGKVIPLLQQYSVAEKARQAAIQGGTSLDKDAETAQQSLARQIAKTREEFLALVRGVTETGTFQVMTKTVLSLATAFIRVADALKPVLPLLGAFAAVKLTRSLGSFASGIGSGLGARRKQAGGMIHAFNSGGYVPGTGNRDTVPAMLTPGEFVIRKSSVNKIGADRLAGMNKYARGGTVADDLYSKNLQKRVVRSAVNLQGTLADPNIQFNKEDTFTSNVRDASYPSKIPKGFVNEGKRIPAKKFEELVALENGGVKGLAKSDIAPLDFVLGSKRIEIKRTLQKVSDDVVRDKTARAIMERQIPGAGSTKVTGDPDNPIGLPPVELASDSQGVIPKKLARRLGLKEKAKKAKEAFFGGLIQKFATGGLVELKRAGAAILDPDENFSDFKYDISTDDVKKTFNEFKSLPRNKDPVSKFYKKSSFTVNRKGLNKETSNKFKVALEDGLVDGVNSAASSLGSDLGLGTKLEGGAKDNFLNSVRTGLYGDLFESLLMTGAKGSAFVGSPNRPFDFPDGLNSKLSDNFSGLPSKFIDAKASETAASQANMKTKVLGQIKQELIQDGILAADYPGKKGVEEQKNKRAGRTARELADKKARGIGFPARRKASGGGISGEDTVPALLTPGEFVINKKSAQSIGYANLSRMNTKGVVGFNKGGSVGLGVQKFRSGGGVGGIADIGLAVGALSSSFSGFIDKSDKASDAQFATAVAAERLSQTLLQSIILFKVIGGARKAITDWEKGVNKSKQAVEEKAQADKEASSEGGESASKAGSEKAKVDKEAAQKPEKKKETTVEKDDKKAKAIQKQQEIKKKDIEDTRVGIEEAKGVKTRQEQQVQAKEKDVKSLQDEQGKRQGIADQAKKEKEASFKDTMNLQKEEKAAAADLKTKQGEFKGEQDKLHDSARKNNNITKQVAEKDAEAERTAKRLQGSKQRENESIQNVGKFEKKNRDIDAKLVDNRKKQQALTKRAAQDPSQIDAANKGQTKLANEEKKLLAQRQKNDASIKKNIGNLRQQEKVTAELSKEHAKANKKASGAKKALSAASDEYKQQAKVVDKSADALNQSHKAHKQANKVAKESAEVTRDKIKKEKAAKKAVLNVSGPLQAAEKKLSGARTQLKTATSGVQAAELKHVNAKKKLVGADKAAEAQAQKQIRSRKHLINTENKALASSTKLGRGLLGLGDRSKKLGATLKITGRNMQKTAVQAALNSKATGKTAKIMNTAYRARIRLGKSIERTGQKLKVFDRNLQKVARSAARLKGSFGVGGRGRAAVAGAGRLAAGAGGVAAMAAMLGQQISGAISEIAGRQKDQAIGRGDIKGAGKGALAESMSNELGRAFTLAGAGQLISDAFTGNSSFAKGASQAIANSVAEASTEAASGSQQRLLKQSAAGGISDDDLLRQVGGASAQAMEKVNFTGKGKFKTKVDAATQDRAKSELKKNESEALKIAARSATSMQDMQKKIALMGNQTGHTTEELKRLGRQFFLVEEAARAVARANFDNAKMMSAFNSASVSVNSFLNSLQTGSLSLEDNIATFEASLSNFGMAEQGKQALEQARQDVLSSINAPAGSEMGNAVNRSFDRAAGVQEFMGSLQSRVAGASISQSSEKAASSDLKKALLSGVSDRDIRSTIESQVDALGDIRGKDISSIITQIKAGLDPLTQGALNSAKALMAHQQTIVALTQQRRKTELEYVKAQQKAVDTQLAAAKRFEEFGGSKLTPGQQKDAAVTRVNFELKDAGLSGLTTGTAGDVGSQRAQLAGLLNDQIIRRQGGGFRGAGGVDENRIAELNGSINGLIKFTNQRMDQIKTEIALIDEKNAAEKASMESLLAGDIAGFLDQQAAAGAAAALRSGSADLASLFGGDAQLAAIKSIQKTEDPAVANRAASIALGQMGITDPNAAGILTGTDPEKTALNQQGQALAREQAELAELQAQSAKMEVASAEMNIATANLKFEGEMNRQARETERASRGVGSGLGAVGMARGGVVYANRGIFVPRGTDTVPAMLTPGEFVVNRNAVQRGNNLQILRAMNSTNGPTGQAAAMSGGGQVGYYALGDIVQSFGNIVGNLAPSISEAASVFSPFVAAVEKLSNIEIGVSSKPVDVTVTLNGANILNVIDEKISNEVLNAVAREIPQYKTNSSGAVTRSSSTLNNNG